MPTEVSFFIQTYYIPLLIIMGIMSILAFALYGIDKDLAKVYSDHSNKHYVRIPEKTLLVIAFFFGGIGAFLGMKIFRHKTNHTSFKICVPIFMILQILLLCFWSYLFLVA